METTGDLRFPRVPGRSLAGSEMLFPEDLAGEVNVLILAFRQHQQADVDDWMARLATAGVPQSPPHSDDGRALAGGVVPLAMYEVPLLGARYAPMRRFIDGGMAVSIRRPDILARTVTVYGQIGPIESGLRLSNRDTVHTVVVERSGAVRLVAHGSVSDQSLAAVASAVGLVD